MSKSSFSLGHNGRRVLATAARKLGAKDVDGIGNVYLVQFCLQKIGSSGGKTFREDFAIIERWLDKHILDTRQPKQNARQQRQSRSDAFYRSWEWRTLRMEVLKERGRRCECCGATPDDLDVAGQPVKICVDHIRPISRYWDCRLEKTNLQVLCDECNQGKGAWDQTDWRRSSASAVSR